VAFGGLAASLGIGIGERCERLAQPGDAGRQFAAD
jgi:hypothetical protein